MTEGSLLVTGGAGFVGSNLVARLLDEGRRVVVFDSLARPGSERNLAWLESNDRAEMLTVVRGDIRDADAVLEVGREADVIYHLAGQVAVTTSVDHPRHDFEVNALGTLNMLEAARRSGRHPLFVFTSTNKVYGGMEEIEVVEDGSRYRFRDEPHGISEQQPLDFHSPYGCSKGSADQYVRDYGRIYELDTVVFRMSCIYGPRQFGNEDQGWLAHFMIRVAAGEPVTIYGDGKQVRDVLFVEDLVRAFLLLQEKRSLVTGQVYNIGGGPENSISVWTEFGEALARLSGRDPVVAFESWRPGDQRCYVSDIRKADKDVGWVPAVSVDEGLRRLWDWVSSRCPTRLRLAFEAGCLVYALSLPDPVRSVSSRGRRADSRAPAGTWIGEAPHRRLLVLGEPGGRSVN